MSDIIETRVGWCPGALRPMASGDGLIVRVKPRGGVLGLPQARQIAEVARRYGNGALDLTSRANLQIRGIREATFGPTIEALDAAGLLDPNPAAEAVRNVVSSPLAGFDPSALIDVRPLVAALERRLTDDSSLHALPAKFSVILDDGGALSLRDVPADIRFEAVARRGGPVFAVRLGDDEAACGLCDTSALDDIAAVLGRVFIAAHRADPAIRRMRNLVRRDGADAVLGSAGIPSLRAERSNPSRPNGLAGLPPRFAPRNDGLRVSKVLAQNYLRVAAPFGRLDADQLDVVASAASEVGAAELRLTPWRAVIIPGLSADAAAAAAGHAQAAGLIVDAEDPRLRVAACPGAPGCHRGTSPVLDHAARLARRLRASLEPAEIALHVSGCAKGCAHAGPAPLTLVGRDGLYDIVIDGRASDRPTLRDLSFEEAKACLKAFFAREGSRYARDDFGPAFHRAAGEPRA